MNIIHLYGIVTLHASISNQHIIFTLSIPLTHKNEYDLFYLTPVPQLVNNTLVAITPTTKMMARYAHRYEYFPMDNTKFLECNTLEHNTLLRSNTQAEYIAIKLRNTLI